MQGAFLLLLEDIVEELDDDGEVLSFVVGRKDHGVLVFRRRHVVGRAFRGVFQKPGRVVVVQDNYSLCDRSNEALEERSRT